MKNRQKAFTLVELLLAATITAMVLGSAFASMSVVLRAYKELGGKTNMAETARLILDRMRTDLEATFLSPHEDVTRFVGYDQMTGELDTDSLTFISSVNNPAETGAGACDIAEIQYYIDLDETTPERWLLRRMDYTIDTDPFSGGELALLGPRVVSLELQYFDGEAWWPEWDSSSAIPIAVNISIGLFEASLPNEEPSPMNIKKFSTTVWIASYRQTSDSNESSDEGGQSGER